MGSISVAGRPLMQVDVAGVSPAGHLYLVYTDDTGDEYVLTAYTSGTGITGAIDVDEVAGSYRVPFDQSEENFIDQNSTDRVFVDLDGRSAENVFDILVQYASSVDSEKLPYVSFYQNSNSFIASALDLVGVDIRDALPNPDGVQLTGFLGRQNILDFDYVIEGSDGNDIIRGRGGSQVLFGLAGEDHLYGGKGTDTLDGGADNDVLNGGEDDDVYEVAFDEGDDMIMETGGAGDILKILGDEDFKYIGTRNHLNIGVGLNPTDARINVLDWNGDARGSVTVQDMSEPKAQIEQVKLLDQGGVTSFGEVDLSVVWEAVERTGNILPWVTAGEDERTLVRSDVDQTQGWWSVVDANGDDIEWWAVYDGNAAPGSSYLSVPGEVYVWDYDAGSYYTAQGETIPSLDWVTIRDNQFEDMRAHAGDLVGNDELYAIAYDGTDWGNWAGVSLDTEQLLV